MRLQLRVVLLAVLLGVALLVAPADAARAKTLSWRRWDSEIRINADGSFDVRETYEIQFIGGAFTFGYRKIPIDKFVSIENVQVSEGDVAYTSSSDHEANTFEWGRDGNEYTIDWYYSPATDQVRRFTVSYRVLGGLYIDANQGDRFFWKAVGPDHDYDVESSTVSVTAPSGAALNPDVAPAYFGADARYQYSSDKQTVTVYAQNIAAGQAFEVGVRFPHGYVPDVAPAWQADEARRPILNLIFGGLGALVLVAGLLGVYLLWALMGRDPEAGVVPEYLSEPPSDLPPGLAGTLVDEKADLQDIIATLVDLARRGALDMEEKARNTFGIVASKDFVFHRRADFTGTLRGYESMLISEVFGTSEQVELSDLKYEFYEVIPKLQRAMYDECVKEGLFPASPQAVRTRYMVLGVAGLVIAGGLGFCVGPLLGDIADTVACVFVGLGVVSVALMGVSGVMPTKSRKGAEEAAKWRAFKTYLQRTERYTDVAGVADTFDRYLPYAIAFGVERSWIAKFSRVQSVPVPGWYFPVGIPYDPMFRRSVGTGGFFGSGGSGGSPVPDLSGGATRPGPSLDGSAGRMFTGLGQMSSGLFSMLNSTASVFTSVPRSSSGSGGWGGGFSGGGFSSGGGGGGGGAGFG